MRRRVPWAPARSFVAATGLAFLGFTLGGACLDFAGEDYGHRCEESSSMTAAGDAGDAGTDARDCGAPDAARPDAGGAGGCGSGSAAPP